jgi:hypothetical protein
MSQVLKMSIYQMDLLLMRPPRAGSFYLHIPCKGSKLDSWNQSPCWAVMSVAPKEIGDRLSPMTLRERSWWPSFFFYTGDNSIYLFACFLLWEVFIGCFTLILLYFYWHNICTYLLHSMWYFDSYKHEVMIKAG